MNGHSVSNSLIDLLSSAHTGPSKHPLFDCPQLNLVGPHIPCRTRSEALKNVDIHHIGENNLLTLGEIERRLIREHLERRINLVTDVPKRMPLLFDLIKLTLVHHSTELGLPQLVERRITGSWVDDELILTACFIQIVPVDAQSTHTADNHPPVGLFPLLPRLKAPLSEVQRAFSHFRSRDVIWLVTVGDDLHDWAGLCELRKLRTRYRERMIDHKARFLVPLRVLIIPRPVPILEMPQIRVPSGVVIARYESNIVPPHRLKALSLVETAVPSDLETGNEVLIVGALADSHANGS